MSYKNPSRWQKFLIYLKGKEHLFALCLMAFALMLFSVLIEEGQVKAIESMEKPWILFSVIVGVWLFYGFLRFLTRHTVRIAYPGNYFDFLLFDKDKHKVLAKGKGFHLKPGQIGVNVRMPRSLKNSGMVEEVLLFNNYVGTIPVPVSFSYKVVYHFTEEFNWQGLYDKARELRQDHHSEDYPLFLQGSKWYWYAHQTFTELGKQALEQSCKAINQVVIEHFESDNSNRTLTNQALCEALDKSALEFPGVEKIEVSIQ